MPMDLGDLATPTTALPAGPAPPGALPPGMDLGELATSERPPAPPVPTAAVSAGAPATGGPASYLPSWLDRMTDAAARGATFGLSDLAGAAGTATGAYLGGRPGTWSENYQQALARQRGEQEQFAAEHPVASTVGSLAGSLTAAPAAGATAGAATLGRQMLTGAGMGAAGGAAGGLAESQQPGGSARDIAYGTGIGAATGATLPVAGGLIGRAVAPVARGASNLAEAIAPGLFGNAIENQALRTIAGRQAYDVAAGMPAAGAPGGLAEQLAAGQAAGRPITFADVGGANVQGLAGKVARAPGPGRQMAADFLDARDAGAPGRLLDDINTLMVPTGVPTGGADNMLAHLEQQQGAEANRLYGLAGANNAGPQRLVNSPELDALVQNSGPIQNAMNSVRNTLPAYANLPDNDMRMLHEAYKVVGNRAQQAVGNPDAYVLGKLQGDFRDALTGANPDYGAALDNFRNYSKQMDAINAGRKIFTQTPDQISQNLQAMPPDQQRMFRLGAADTMAQQVLGTTSGGNEALRVVGNQLRQQQLRPLFASDDQFNDFINRATTENQLFRTKQAILGGSQTAPRLAEDTGGGAPGAFGPLAAGTAAIYAGEPFAGVTQLATGLSRLARPAEINDPAVNAEIARRLYSADPTAQRETLARMLALPGPMAPKLALPAGGLAGQLVGPGLTPAVNWAAGLPFMGRRQ